MRSLPFVYFAMLPTLAAGQSVLWSRTGPMPDGLSSPSFPGYFDAGLDVDGDGVPDVVAGAASAPGPIHHLQGKVFVYSGSDGTLLHEVAGETEFAYLGRAVLLTGDLDGDGLSEFAAVGVDGGPTWVYSGADGSVHWAIPPVAPWYCDGWWPLARTDRDGDGVPDLVLGCPYGLPPGAPGGGGVAIVSGADGSVLDLWDGPEILDRFGFAIAAAGDQDGDGVEDLLVGAPAFTYEWETDWHTKSYASLRSGATGEVIAHFPQPPIPEGAQPVNNRMGWSVAAGDVDGDGVLDLVVAASWGLAVAPPSLSVISGASGELLYLFDEPFSGGPSSVRFLGDVDGDGFGDFLVGNQTMKEAKVYAGPDFEVLYTLEHEGSVSFGSQAAAAGDLDGDGFPDVVVGDKDWWNGQPPVTTVGRITAFSLIPKGVTVLGEGCPGCGGEAPRIGARGSPVPGGEVRVHLSQAAPGARALLAVGFSSESWEGVPLPVSLDGFGLPGCSLFTSVDAAFLHLTQADLPAPGRASAEFLLPNDPALEGVVFHAQWLVAGGAEFPASVTRALRFEISSAWAGG